MQCSKRMRSSANGLSVDGRQPQRLRVLEGGLGLDDLHFALAADLLQTGGERGDDLFLLRPQGVEADGGRWEGDAPGFEVFGFAHDLGDVQQGLRGDAAAQQADAAQPRFEIDQGDLHSQIGGQKAAAYPPGPPPMTTSCVSMKRDWELGIRDWRE